MYAVYENKGTLDMRALTVMGVNSKPLSDNPIGFFGTGLKYAIAVLARMDCRIEIQDGAGDVYIVKSNLDTFRDKDFTMLKLVADSGKTLDLPFTTELGKNWQPWMAMREIECNARDENGGFQLLPQRPVPEDDTVRIIVQGEVFISTILSLRKEVFYDLKVGGNFQAFNKALEVAPIATQNVWYRNIMVHTHSSRTYMHSYNLLSKTELTEDRTMKYPYLMDSYIARLFMTDADDAYRRRILDNPNAAEWLSLQDRTDPESYSPEALACIHGYFKSGKELPDCMVMLMRRHQINQELNIDRKLQDNETEMLAEALDRLALCGYLFDDYTIKCVDTLPNNALGLVEMGVPVIRISATNFEMGLECLMGTLLEEYAHLKFQYYDNSREFQDWLLRQTIINSQRYLKQLKRNAHV